MITVKRFIFNPFSENTYLLYDETKEAAIIDCGCISPTEENALAAWIAEKRLIPRLLLATHYHFDHVIGNAFIYRTYGLKPMINSGECANGTPALNLQASSFGIPAKFEEIVPEKFIKINEEVKFGNSALVALNVAGHSPASLAYYSEADKAVFAGDAIFRGSIGRTDLWGGSHDTLIGNIKKNIFTLPDDTIIYPGHGPSTTVGEEKEHNPYFIG